MILLLSAVLACFTSIAVITVIIAQATRMGLLQGVNERSSHTIPTPVGGGVGLLLGTLLGSVIGLIAFSDNWAPYNHSLIIGLVLAALIGLVGLIDDRWPISAKARLLIQFGGFAVLVYNCGTIFPMSSDFATVTDISGGVLIVIAGVWWLNLFNFLDGIDGYAGSEALFLLLAPLLLVRVQSGSVPIEPLTVVMVCSATAILGFLLFNWPPARIFMGDAGSTFLGFLIFVIAILSIQIGWLSVWQWLLLGSVFISDATITLLRRLIGGQKLMQAHKSHAYQILSCKWNGHKPTLYLSLGINVVILLPLAWLANVWPSLAPVIVLVVMTILACGVWIIGSEKADFTPRS